MRKSTLFLSAVLTTFMLAVMVGAVSAYQKTVKTTSAAVQPTAAQPVQNVNEPLTPAPAPAFTPDQAAALAAQVMGRTDLYSVETTDFNGASVYLVTFTSGDLVYVSPEGQILSISKIVPTVISGPAASQQRRSRDDNSSAPAVVTDDHGDDGEHEDH